MDVSGATDQHRCKSPLPYEAITMSSQSFFFAQLLSLRMEHLELSAGSRRAHISDHIAVWSRSKSSIGISDTVLPAKLGESFMPTDTIVVLIMATAFGIFAATLYWADVRTRGLSK